jgi:hypothetical protein
MWLMRCPALEQEVLLSETALLFSGVFQVTTLGQNEEDPSAWKTRHRMAAEVPGARLVGLDA